MTRNVCKCQKITHIFVTLYIIHKKIHMETIKKENKLNLKFYIHQMTFYITFWWLSTTNDTALLHFAPWNVIWNCFFRFFPTLLCLILKKNTKKLSEEEKTKNSLFWFACYFCGNWMRKCILLKVLYSTFTTKTTNTFELRQKLSACGLVERVWRR